MATIAASDLVEQYRLLTEACGLVDRSERGKLALTGADAAEFLNGQVTNDVVALHPGGGCYAAFLTHRGKMLGDLRILAVGSVASVDSSAGSASSDGTASNALAAGEPFQLLLDTERMALQALFDMIRRFSIGYDVQLHKRTVECSLLSLIGPATNAVAERALDKTDGTWVGDEEHHHTAAQIGGVPVRLIKTDTGIDVLYNAAHTEPIASALQASGAVAVSEDAAEIARVERGRPRYGVDMDDSTIPQEAGINERAVSFTKGCYVGQETVARLYYKGKPNRLLRGLRLSEPVDAGTPLLLGEREVGRLASSVLSPAFGPIGLALVRVQAEPGATLSIDGHAATAVVTELPFR